jgi:membrane peptidoglycan carboxypeptidase
MNARRGIALGVALFAVAATSCNLPKLSDAQAQAKQLPQTSFIYAADGSQITALHAEQNRVVVPLSKISDVTRNAVISIEDRRFYYHHGIDFKGLMRAAYVDATSGQIVEGGSTITEQLVKQLYVGSAQTITRKVDEASLAWQMEDKYTKDQILAMYLNTVYFGEGAYGIQAAAQRYFGENASQLTLAQSALLAGVIAIPSTTPCSIRKRRSGDARSSSTACCSSA